MAHSHGDTHTVIERDSSNHTGLLIGFGLLVLLATIGLAVLFAAPWDDDSGGGDTSPGISEDVVPGDGRGDVVPGDGGTDGSGTDDGSGGEQPQGQ